MFALSGIRVPKRDEGKDGEEMSNAALNFSRERLHQTEVNLEVDGLDKGGNFVGTVYTGKKVIPSLSPHHPPSLSLTCSLLELRNHIVRKWTRVHSLPQCGEIEGLQGPTDCRRFCQKQETRCMCPPPSQSSLPLPPSLSSPPPSPPSLPPSFCLPTKNQYWKNYDEEAEKAKLAAAAAESGDVGPLQGKTVEVIVTEVVDGARFHVQMNGPGKWEGERGRWEMGDGRWEMGDGRWEMGDGRDGGGRERRGEGRGGEREGKSGD